MLRLQLKTSFFDRDIDVNFVSLWETSDPRPETEIHREPQGNQVTAIKTGRWTRFRFPRLPSLLSLFSHNPEKHEDHHDLPVLFKISDLKILHDPRISIDIEAEENYNQWNNRLNYYFYSFVKYRPMNFWLYFITSRGYTRMYISARRMINQTAKRIS